MDENASPKELQDRKLISLPAHLVTVHVRLQEEMITIDEMETNLHSEIETLGRREIELTKQAEQFMDLDQLSKDAEHNLTVN